jgi:hypothetical protein
VPFELAQQLAGGKVPHLAIHTHLVVRSWTAQGRPTLFAKSGREITLMLLSLLSETTTWPLGSTATALTHSVWPVNVRTHSRRSRSHTCGSRQGGRKIERANEHQDGKKVSSREPGGSIRGVGGACLDGLVVTR